MCLAFIMVLSAVPLAATIYVAIGRPPVSCPDGSGGRAPRGSSGNYRFCHLCTDDLPMFVAIWYVLAIGLMSMFGLAGTHYAGSTPRRDPALIDDVLSRSKRACTRVR